jgi:hypothetical protein
MTEVTPDAILSRLDKGFLEAQSDRWIRRLYEFLGGQPALVRQRRVARLPLIRLEDGRHVAVQDNGRQGAFLPGPMASGFPTVRKTVCATPEATRFLRTLGLTVPDPVDDVIVNLLPKYSGNEVDVPAEEYDRDIDRILAAFGSDSKSQREKLVDALKPSHFVIAVDAGDGTKSMTTPEQLYLPTQRLKQLFAGVDGVLLVDDSHGCLRGEGIRELLEACGAARTLQPELVGSRFGWRELAEMRKRSGAENTSGGDKVSDYTLRGLNALLEALPLLEAEQAAHKAKLLWEALGDMHDRRGAGSFRGRYEWTHYRLRSCPFDAGFVERLREAAWVPSRSGELQPPSAVLFEATGWKENPFLLSKIHFKPPILEALAREAGIEPGVLDLLKKFGMTNAADLRARLGIGDGAEAEEEKPDASDSVNSAETVPGEAASYPTPNSPVPSPRGGESGPPGGNGRSGGKSGTGSSHTGQRSSQSGTGDGRRRRTGNGKHPRPFISYVATHPDEVETDPDGLEHAARMKLEDVAISLILEQEPRLQRTPPNNPGFDLFAVNEQGTPIKYVEVKAMTGSLEDRPVGLSHTQFKTAQKHGDSYWLYVVERAGSPEAARIVRIQDPFGQARTFTFDRGWIGIADTSDAVATRGKERGEV